LVNRLCEHNSQLISKLLFARPRVVARIHKYGHRSASGPAPCLLWVKLGHSAMSAQCPVCPKAYKAGRFISTRLKLEQAALTAYTGQEDCNSHEARFAPHVTHCSKPSFHRLVCSFRSVGMGSISESIARASVVRGPR